MSDRHISVVVEYALGGEYFTACALKPQGDDQQRVQKAVDGLVWRGELQPVPADACLRTVGAVFYLGTFKRSPVYSSIQSLDHLCAVLAGVIERECE